MCWFEYGITKSVGRPAVARGLGFLPGSNSVHYDGEPERRPVYLEAVATARSRPAGPSTTAPGCSSAGRALAEVVASRPAPAPTASHAVDGAAVEEAIEPRLLKSQAHRRPDGAAGGRGDARAARRAARLRRG